MNISAESFLEIDFQAPPDIQEQEYVAGLLKKLDAVIALQQSKCDRLVSIKKALLGKLFPKDGETVPEIRFAAFEGKWSLRTLGQISHSYSGGTPTVSRKEYYGGTIPFIRSGEISSNSTELFISERGLSESSAKLVDKGDILYALYGATSGEVSVSRLYGAINQAILAIIPEEGYDSYFIVQWLRMRKSSIVDTYLQGGQGNLSAAIVKGLEIPCPHYNEQVKIGNVFRELDELIAGHQTKLDKLKQLKQAFLERMFV